MVEAGFGLFGLLLGEDRPIVNVGGMEQFLSLFAAGGTEILVVKDFDIGVIVRLADRHVLVDAIEHVGPLLTVGVEDVDVLVREKSGFDEWLSTTVDASAGAAHDLDEGIGGFASPDFIKKRLGVLHAGGDGDLDLGAFDVDLSLFHGIKAADLGEVDLAVFLAREGVVCGAEGSFHDSAGDAEDDACASVLAEEILIEFLFGELFVDDAGALDHDRELAGRDDGVDVGEVLNRGILRAAGLVFLRGAGHDRDDEDVLRVKVVGLGEVALDDRAFHLVRGFAGRDVRDDVAIEELHVVDPAWRAGCDLGEHSFVGDAVDELLRLFHDGEVGAEVGVEDAIEAKAVKRGDHLSGGVVFADLVAEFLGEGASDGWGGLDDDVLAFGHRAVDLVDLAVLGQSAGRADFDALAALDARHIGEGAVFRRSDDGVESALLEAEDADSLGLFALLDAAAAEDALAGVADDAGGGVIIGGRG